MVLLDLIGSQGVSFFNTFNETNDLFERLEVIGEHFLCVCGFYPKFLFKFLHFQNGVFDFHRLHACDVVCCIFLNGIVL